MFIIKYKMLIDSRDGVSYPDAVKKPDRAILLIPDYARVGTVEILLTAINEEDSVHGTPPNASNLRILKVISSGFYNLCDSNVVKQERGTRNGRTAERTERCGVLWSSQKRDAFLIPYSLGYKYNSNII